MKYKFIKHIGIKYFPSNFLDYLGHYFINFIFSLIFIINIPFLNNTLFNNYKSSYILLIPKITYNYEEKKDLIKSLWDVAFADGRIDKYEDYTIRKIADLIYVRHEDFMKAKHR